MTIGLINMSLQTRSDDLAADGPWPVRISRQRVNALAPGAIELITLTAEVPSLAVSGDAVDVRLTATDQDSQIELQRNLKLIFRLPSGGGGSKRMLPVD